MNLSERIVLRDGRSGKASFDLSLRMVAPRCLMHREGGTFEELPAYDLAMQSDAAVVLCLTMRCLHLVGC